MKLSRKLIWPVAVVVAAGAAYTGNLASSSLQAGAKRTSQPVEPLTLYASASADASMGLDYDLDSLQLVWKVLNIVKDYYVDEIDPYNNTKMAQSAVKYMVASLGDSNSQFLDKDASTTLAEMAQGHFSGIGAVLKIRERKEPNYTDQQLTVVAALPGSPAERAGLLPGDVILEVDGKWVMSHDPFSDVYKLSKDYKASYQQKKHAFDSAKALQERAISLGDASEKLMSARDGELQLKVERAGKTLPTIKLTPGQMTPDLVQSRMLADGIGYIRIILTTPDTPQRFRQALAGLISGGAKSVILDLRNSPGGQMTAAQEIAGALIGPKKLAMVTHSRGRVDVLNGRGNAVGNVRLVGLVNMGTEGTSEVLAAGLREASGMKLIGETTWGNGFERTAFRLPDGSGYTLTTGKISTPGKYDFNKIGVKPDAIVPMLASRIGQPDDAQLERALTVARRPVSQTAQLSGSAAGKDSRS